MWWRLNLEGHAPSWLVSHEQTRGSAALRQRPDDGAPGFAFGCSNFLLAVRASNGYSCDMTAIKAHFDGKVLVPEEPLHLPVNEPLNVYVEPSAADAAPLQEVARALSELPDNQNTPADLATQHNHYLHGLPKRP
jgi:hypothetical protein